MPWHYQQMYLELMHEEIDREVEEQEKQSGTKTQRVNAAGDLSGTPFTVTRVGG